MRHTTDQSWEQQQKKFDLLSLAAQHTSSSEYYPLFLSQVKAHSAFLLLIFFIQPHIVHVCVRCARIIVHKHAHSDTNIAFFSFLGSFFFPFRIYCCCYFEPIHKIARALECMWRGRIRHFHLMNTKSGIYTAKWQTFLEFLACYLTNSLPANLFEVQNRKKIVGNKL